MIYVIVTLGAIWAAGAITFFHRKQLIRCIVWNISFYLAFGIITAIGRAVR